MCIAIVEIWFGIANEQFANFWQSILSVFDRVICPTHDKGGIVFHIFICKFEFVCIVFTKYLKNWQTVETPIRLLLQEQSDQSLHCLHMLLGQLLYFDIFFYFRAIWGEYWGYQKSFKTSSWRGTAVFQPWKCLRETRPIWREWEELFESDQFEAYYCEVLCKFRYVCMVTVSHALVLTISLDKMGIQGPVVQN